MNKIHGSSNTIHVLYSLNKTCFICFSLITTRETPCMLHPSFRRCPTRSSLRRRHEDTTAAVQTIRRALNTVRRKGGGCEMAAGVCGCITHCSHEDTKPSTQSKEGWRVRVRNGRGSVCGLVSHTVAKPCGRPRRGASLAPRSSADSSPTPSRPYAAQCFASRRFGRRPSGVGYHSIHRRHPRPPSACDHRHPTCLHGLLRHVSGWPAGRIVLGRIVSSFPPDVAHRLLLKVLLPQR